MKSSEGDKGWTVSKTNEKTVIQGVQEFIALWIYIVQYKTHSVNFMCWGYSKILYCIRQNSIALLRTFIVVIIQITYTKSPPPHTHTQSHVTSWLLHHCTSVWKMSYFLSFNFFVMYCRNESIIWKSGLLFTIYLRGSLLRIANIIKIRKMLNL